MSEEKANVRGTINALPIHGRAELPKGKHKPSYVRNAASTLAADTGKKFSVAVSDEVITVTRTA